MRLIKILLVMNVVVWGGCGIGAMLMPAKVLSQYGVTPGPAATLLARYAGLGSIAIGLVAWFARNVEVEDPRAQRAIVLTLLITSVVVSLFGSSFLGDVISSLGTISGVMTTGSPVVALYVLLASGYAYFQFTKPGAS